MPQNNEINIENVMIHCMSHVSSREEDRILANHVLDQILTGWPYLARTRGVCHELGSLLQDIGRNNK